MKYVIDLHVTPRGFFFSANFILGECTVGVLNCTIKETRIMNSSIQSLAGLQLKKHWSATSKTWNLLECYEAAKHYLNQICPLSWSTTPPWKLLFDYPLLAKGTAVCWPMMSQTHSLNYSKLRACRCCQLSLKVGKATAVKSEAWWGFLICGISKVWYSLCLLWCVYVCVSVGAWECVFALCSLLWECCSRWGLLTELELSFHTRGN